MQTVSRACLVVAVLCAAPGMAFGQASITGVVRDPSGGVLPGVTVEATSPDLIEKVRTAVTDDTGRYRVLDLRPGTYTVTFGLPGFNTVRREGITLQGTFTATVDVEMRVGGVEETVVVTGESPIVDVQSVRRQTVIDDEVITAIPASRSYTSLMSLMPSTVTAAGSAMDVQVVPGMVVFGGAGGRGNEGRLQLDGLSVGSAFNGAGVSSYIPDVGNAREITMTTSGGLGEAEVGGPSLNVVPREGGNAIRGTFYGAGVTEGMVGANYTDELRSRGLTTPGALQKVWDFNLGLGGPIKKDRLWYYLGLRDEGSHRTVPGMFANANAGDPTKWTYVPDQARPAVLAASYRNTSLRLTAQATPRNKFAIFWDQQLPCEGGAAPGFDGSACRHSDDNEVVAGSTAAPTPSASAILAPETAAYRDYGQRVNQTKWTSPVTNRLLVEAGLGSYRSRWGGKNIPGLPTSDLIRVVEQCATTCAANGNIPGLTYRSGNWSSNVNMSVNWYAAGSYIVGSHSMKVGYQAALLYDERKNYTNSEFLQYRTQNGVPDQMTLTINQFPVRQRVRSDAFYFQDQWTIGRMTLQGAMRYDHTWSYFPEATVGPVRFFPTAVTYPHTVGVEGFHELTPRGGVAYDLFGTGKTSLKVNAGRYMEAAQNGGAFIASNPTGRLQTSTTRAWTDANENFVADCDLLNPAAQDLRGAGRDFCGAYAVTNFGSQVFSTTLDPSLVSGWNVRPGDWQIGASVQHELLPRVAVEMGYQRRWLVNFQATDNRTRGPEDHTQFGLTVPTDPRLPGGGGGVLQRLYNVTPAAALRLTDNLVTLASNYGSHTQVANTIHMNVTARPRNGLMLQGGFNSARTDTDFCEIQAAVPEFNPISVVNPINPFNPWCETSPGFVTRFTALGAYTVPRIDVQVAGTMRSDQGAELAANWNAPNSATVGLNRPFAGTAGQIITVNLVEPGAIWGDRVNQFDLRIAKILRFGRTRTNVGFDIYNVSNASPVLTYNQNYSPTTTTWLTPTSVLQPRFVKFSAQVDF
jgi:hypothetical protein